MIPAHRHALTLQCRSVFKSMKVEAAGGKEGAASSTLSILQISAVKVTEVPPRASVSFKETVHY